MEGEDKKRWASNDAWTFCLAEGKWSAVRYAPVPVPQVRGAGAAWLTLLRGFGPPGRLFLQKSSEAVAKQQRSSSR